MDELSVQLISIILSGIIGLGGIIIAGLSAYWSRSERIEPLKHRLYDQQVNGATKCINAIVELQHEIEKHHSQISYPVFFEDEEQRKSFVKVTEAKRNELKSTLYKWSHLLPYQVFAPLTHYLSIVEYASGKRNVFDGWAGSSYPHDSPWTELPRYFLESIAAVREFLGIDPLSSQLSETIGVSEEERKQEIAEKTQALGYLMSHDYRPYQSYQHGYILSQDYVSGENSAESDS